MLLQVLLTQRSLIIAFFHLFLHRFFRFSQPKKQIRVFRNLKHKIFFIKMGFPWRKLLEYVLCPFRIDCHFKRGLKVETYWANRELRTTFERKSWQWRWILWLGLRLCHLSRGVGNFVSVFTLLSHTSWCRCTWGKRPDALHFLHFPWA